MALLLFKTFDTNICILGYKGFDTNVYMSKYKNILLEIVSKDKIKSTNEILEELQNKVHKAINWHALYRILMELESERKIEKLKSKAGFFWKKR